MYINKWKDFTTLANVILMHVYVYGTVANYPLGQKGHSLWWSEGPWQRYPICTLKFRDDIELKKEIESNTQNSLF